MRLRELTESTVTVNKRLNPVLWHDGDLRDEVRAKLLKIAAAFETFLGIPLPIQDYTITGSNANYTWTKYSDIDLHLIIPGKATAQQRELFTAKKSLWSAQRTITIKGLPVECYVQGQDEPHHSTGVYSLSRQRWLVVPKKVQPQVADAAVDAKKTAVLRAVETALLTRDLDQLTRVKDKISQMRKSGLQRTGEWSVENLVFKVLRNLGVIDTLTDTIRELQDADLSLEQQQMP